MGSTNYGNKSDRLPETRPQDDDASEWSPEPFLDTLGDNPVTFERLVEWLDEQDEQLRSDVAMGVVTVEELLKKVRESR